MIPRLNRCPDCNSQDVLLSTFQHAALDMHRAMHDLLFVVCEALRIDCVAEWLARRLP